MPKFIVLLKWKLGMRGKKCQCGFHEGAHFNPDLEWDMDSYPCDKFRPVANQTKGKKSELLLLLAVVICLPLIMAAGWKVGGYIADGLWHVGLIHALQSVHWSVWSVMEYWLLFLAMAAVAYSLYFLLCRTRKPPKQTEKVE